MKKPKKVQKPARKLSHLDAKGKARMVDVSGKADTQREAVAEATVVMDAATWKLVARPGRSPRGTCSPPPASPGSWPPSARRT